MVEYLTPKELETLLASIPSERDKLLTQFLYESGCSVSEASELKASSVRKDGALILADRTSRISPKLANALLEQASTYIFHTRQSEGITPKRIQQILKPYIAAIHKGKTTPHILRYTHILHAYKRGVSLHAIASQTGLTLVRLGQIFSQVPAQDNYNAFFEKEGEQ